MNRQVSAAVVCAGLGALASYGAVRTVQRGAIVDVGPSHGWEGPAPRGSALSSTSSLVDARLAIFERAAALADPASMEQAILRAARSAPSAARDVELEALLLRFLETDRARAIRFATEQALEARFVATMFRALASLDPDAAIAELANVANADLRRSAATALVDVLRSAEAIERLAAIAGQGNPQGFVVTALEQLASLDPLDAILQAERLPDDLLRIETFERIAREWALLDAPAALRYVPEIAEASLRNRFHAAAVSAWVTSDPDGALAYLQSGEGGRLLSILGSFSSAELLNAIALRFSLDGPERLLTLADGLGTDFGELLRGMAISRAFEEDWPGELARLETMPAGSEYQSLALRIATAYAREDPDAALAWAKGLDQLSVSKQAVGRVVSAIGFADPFGALDLALANDVEFWPGVARWSEFSPEELATLADKLSSGGPTQRRPLDTLMEYWPRRDSAGQWDWLMRNSDTVDASMVRNAAIGIASVGHALPAQTIYRLPEELREHWIVSFAGEYTKREPDAGLRWLSELERDPGYDRWATAIVNNLLATPEAMRGDPAMSPLAPVLPGPAAEILAKMREPPRDLVISAATLRARTEPMEVARWASGLADAELRMLGVVAGVGAWTVNDPVAARQWSLGLPPGTTRDRALLTQLVQEIATHGTVSQPIVAALGTRENFHEVLRANRPAFAQAFRSLGSRDYGAAAALLDRYVADEEMKSTILADIDAGRASGFPPWPRERLVSIGQ